MDKDYLDKLIEWQQGKQGRMLEIKIGMPGYKEVEVWAFDTLSGYSQSVQPPNLPNIEAIAEENDRRRYRELHERFGDE